MNAMELSTVPWLEILVMLPPLVLASWRVTRFVVYDTIFDAPRFWLVEKLIQKPEGGLRERGFRAKTAELITCPYCAGVWVSLGWTAIATLSWPWQFGIGGLVLWMSIAGGQAILHSWTDGRG